MEGRRNCVLHGFGCPSMDAHGFLKTLNMFWCG